MPKGYKPTYKRAVSRLGNGVDIDIQRRWKPNQQLHAYTVLQENTKIISFEPHLHAPGARMCLEAIWGYNIQTLNCVGYDHNWVRGYDYDRRLGAAAAEGHHPAHHRLHGQLADEQERAGSAQLAGLGQPLGREHVHRPRAARRADRRAVPGGDGQAPRAAASSRKNDVVIGCPLCNVIAAGRRPKTRRSGQQQ